MAELDTSGMISVNAEAGSLREDDRLYEVDLSFVPKDGRKFMDLVLNESGIHRPSTSDLESMSALYAVHSVECQQLSKMLSGVSPVLDSVHSAEHAATSFETDGMVPPRVGFNELGLSFNLMCTNSNGNGNVKDCLILDEYAGTSGSYLKVNLDQEYSIGTEGQFSKGSFERLHIYGVLHKDQLEVLFKGLHESGLMQDFELEDYWKMKKVKDNTYEMAQNGLSKQVTNIVEVDCSGVQSIASSHHAFVMYSQALSFEEKEARKMQQEAEAKEKELKFMAVVGDACVTQGLEQRDEHLMALGVKIHEYEKLFRNSDRCSSEHAVMALDFILSKEGDRMPDVPSLRKEFEKKWEVERDLKPGLDITKEVPKVLGEIEDEMPVEIVVEKNGRSRGDRGIS